MAVLKFTPEVKSENRWFSIQFVSSYDRAAIFYIFHEHTQDFLPVMFLLSAQNRIQSKNTFFFIRSFNFWAVAECFEIF